MIELEVNSQRFVGWSSISVGRSIEMASGRFQFEALGQREGFPISQGAEVKVFVEDELFISGFIEQISTRYDTENHSVLISGRDKTADLIDSNLDGEIEINPPFTLAQLAQKVLANIGLDLDVAVNDVSLLKPFDQDSPGSSETAHRAFDVIEQYARKRQALITFDGDNTLIFTRGSGERIDGFIKHVLGALDNNVKSAEINLDNSERFGKYVFHSIANPSFLGLNDIKKTEENIVERKVKEEDFDIRQSRILQIQAENSTDIADLQERVKWEANIRRARSVSYNYKMQGFKSESEIWKPNRIIKVTDDFAGLNNSDFLIKAVEFNFDLNTGSTTDLELVVPDAYSLQVQRPQSEKKADKINVFQLPKGEA